MNGIIVACLYAPNGNPQPGPKFDYKLAWHERFEAHAAGLFATGLPVALAGDYNIVPEPRDIYPTKSYDDNALVQPQSRAAFARLLEPGLGRRAAQDASRGDASIRSGITGETAGSATPACASITCCSARNWRAG